MEGAASLSRYDSGIAAVALGDNQHYYVKYNTLGTQAGWYTGSWTDIGGDFIDEPAMVSWGGKRLDVVGVGADGRIWHKSGTNGTWESGWRSLGRPGSVTPSAPAITSWGENRLDILIRSGIKLYHKRWSNTGWSSWTEQGCCIVGKPAAVSWGTNRLDIVATGTDSGIWHKAYTGSWGGWRKIGDGILAGTSPAIASKGPNHLNIYALEPDGILAHKAWGTSGWSGWSVIGGISDYSPAAVTSPSGRAHVALTMNNGKYDGMWHRNWN
jgi:hypothetical protein